MSDFDYDTYALIDSIDIKTLKVLELSYVRSACVYVLLLRFVIELYLKDVS